MAPHEVVTDGAAALHPAAVLALDSQVSGVKRLVVSRNVFTNLERLVAARKLAQVRI